MRRLLALLLLCCPPVASGRAALGAQLRLEGLGPRVLATAPRGEGRHLEVGSASPEHSRRAAFLATSRAAIAREAWHILEVAGVCAYVAVGVATANFVASVFGWGWGSTVFLNIFLWPISVSVALALSRARQPAGAPKPESSGPAATLPVAQKRIQEETHKDISSKIAKAFSDDQPITADALAEQLKLPIGSAELWHRWLSGGKELTRTQLLASAEKLHRAGNDEICGILFEVYNARGDGFLTMDEASSAVSACCAGGHGAPAIGGSKIDELVGKFIRQVDSDGDGKISREEWMALAQRFPDFFGSLVSPLHSFRQEWSAGGSDGQHVAEVAHGVPYDPHGTRHDGKAWLGIGAWLQMRPQEIWFVLIVVGFWVAIWFFKFHHVATHGSEPPNGDPSNAGALDASDGFGWAYVVARASGATLNAMAAILLPPVCGKYMTYLRHSYVGKCLPLDKAVEFHKFAGLATMLIGGLHAVAHLVNYRCCWQRFTLWQHLTSQDGFRPEWTGLAGLTGVLLIVILAIMVVCAQPFIRRTSSFEVFYKTHMLWLPWYICLFLHAPNCWKWLSVPVALYLVDRARLLIRINTGECRTSIQKMEVLPCGTTRLEIVKPRNFSFTAGEYVFIKIPALSKLEWHPFTISSAPELNEVFTLHVRALGNWTNALKDLAAKGPDGQELDVDVQGPYGAPSERVWDSEHAVLIAAGIGVTPFASILQSIHARRSERELAFDMGSRLAGQSASADMDPQIQKEMQQQLVRVLCPSWSEKPFKAKKVDFVWVNRNQDAFAWFVQLLAYLEADDRRISKSSDPLMSFSLYLTGLVDPHLMQNALLSLALQVAYEQKHQDELTGLTSRVRAGRPDWRAYLEEIKAQNNGKVCVLFCGPEVMAHDLWKHCDELGFEFHKENF